VRLEFLPPTEDSPKTSHQEDAVSVTADISSNDVAQTEAADNGTAMAGRYLLVAAVLFAAGLVVAALASLQLVLPNVLSGSAYTTYGRLAPAGRILVTNGWLPLAGLGLAFYVVAQITGEQVQRRTLGTVALILMTIGAVVGAGAVLAGLSSGVQGQEGPIWVRGFSAIGYVLATFAITATARLKADRLGAAGWYLTAAAWWLSAGAVFGLIPLIGGTPGLIQASFANAGSNRLFVVTMAVGLLYFALSKISGADLAEPRPLAALGFWSLTLTWAFMGGVNLVYSSSPDWYETLTIAFAIGALVPVLAIVTDLGLILKDRVQGISDRATLRYAVVGGLTLVAATIVNLLLAWRATSAVVQYSTWTVGLDMLVALGGGSFAVFAANSVRRGGAASNESSHFSWSVTGLVGASAALLAGGIVTGFSWIAGPSSQLFSNYGSDYEIAVVSLEPFLWIAAISLTLYAIAQIAYLIQINRSSDVELDSPESAVEYDLEFEGSTRYVTWKMLVWGATSVWVAAAVFTAAMPILDSSEAAATITADRFRTYEPGTPELAGRDLYISLGCAECHTQSVRPTITDVGLGAVSVAGDYANEDPAVIAGIRFGPDLMHVADREAFDPSSVAAHLLDPRADRSWSTMPSYSYLAEADINAIVSYIETLR